MEKLCIFISDHTQSPTKKRCSSSFSTHPTTKFFDLGVMKGTELLLFLSSNGSHSLNFANCRVVRRMKREIVNQRSTQRKIHLKLQRKFQLQNDFLDRKRSRDRAEFCRSESVFLCFLGSSPTTVCVFVLFCISSLPPKMMIL
jgi:hypothetical protein